MSYQTSAPKAGERAVIMHTTLGDIKIKLFEKEAPKAVENFTVHAGDGYYNGLKFHRVIKDFMIQGGDPQGTGIGGESIWGSPFEDEFSENLHNIRGSLCMANAGPSTNGSQFFIVQAKTTPPQMLSQMKDLVGRGFTEECIEDYKSLGGTPWLDFRHTVFGFVYEGMDVVDAIAEVPVGANDMPREDVLINSIDVITL